MSFIHSLKNPFTAGFDFLKSPLRVGPFSRCLQVFVVTLDMNIHANKHRRKVIKGSFVDGNIADGINYRKLALGI